MTTCQHKSKIGSYKPALVFERRWIPRKPTSGTGEPTKQMFFDMAATVKKGVPNGGRLLKGGGLSALDVSLQVHIETAALRFATRGLFETKCEKGYLTKKLV